MVDTAKANRSVPPTAVLGSGRLDHDVMHEDAAIRPMSMANRNTTADVPFGHAEFGSVYPARISAYGRLRSFVWLLGLVSLCLLAGLAMTNKSMALGSILSAHTDQGSGANERFVVSLDLFSGRPNPSWALTSQQAETLRQMLASTKQASSRGRPEPGLGYRGFLILQEGAGHEPRETRIFDGVVVHNDSVRLDDDRVIERWLAQALPDTIRDDLGPDLVRTIMQQF